jgi:hypothetical protein
MALPVQIESLERRLEDVVGIEVECLDARGEPAGVRIDLTR